MKTNIKSKKNVKQTNKTRKYMFMIVENENHELKISYDQEGLLFGYAIGTFTCTPNQAKKMANVMQMVVNSTKDILVNNAFGKAFSKFGEALSK
jgi:hypothetical protein